MQFVSATTVDQDEPGGLIVKGIVYSEDSSFAIIGTEIVHEGGTVSGATVVKINPDSVEFEMNGKRWTQKVQ
jgi:type II secretory pathway component PulC